MGIRTTTSLVHWNYFLALEKDLENLARYIEFSKSNFKCYSLEMARILLAASSEVDVVAKQLCRKIKSSSKASSINQYRSEIQKAYPKITKYIVAIPRYGLELTPWSSWRRKDNVPLWWTAYNKIKHHRNTDFNKANLKNVINAVAGLYVIVLYFYKEKAKNAELLPMPSLFRVTEENFGGTTFLDIEFGIHYEF